MKKQSEHIRLYDTRSPAKQAQAKHWETMGQLASAKSLAAYVLSYDPYLSRKQKQDIQKAVDHLWLAFCEEREKNQFINLNLPRGF